MKTNMKLLAILSALLLLVACNACSPTDNPITPGDDNIGVKNPVDNQISFTAKVNGEDWEASHVTAVQHDGNPTGTSTTEIRQFTVKGETESGDVIQFVLQRISDEAFGVGNYEVGHIPTGTDDYSIVFLYDGSEGVFQTFPTKSTGNIAISKMSGKELEGTFDVTLHQGIQGDSLTITEGAFKTNKYGAFY